MQIYDTFLPVLVFASLFREANTSHNIQFNPEYDVVRQDIEKQINHALKTLAAYPQDKVQDALFAVSAYIDESILTSSWEHKVKWIKEPLQLIYFSTTNAGILFYEHLNKLLTLSTRKDFPETIAVQNSSMPEIQINSEPNTAQEEKRKSIGVQEYLFKQQKRQKNLPTTAFLDQEEVHTQIISTSFADNEPSTLTNSSHKEILCLYATCMALGFKGQYYSAEQQKEIYSLTLQSMEQALKGRVQMYETLITPDAYYMPQAEKTALWKRILSLSVLIVIPLLCTFYIYTTYNSLLALHYNTCLQLISAI